MIQDPLLVFAYLAALVALVFQVARRPALRPLFERLPALVWTYFLPMLSTTAGILPAESPVYRANLEKARQAAGFLERLDKQAPLQGMVSAK